jgi:hypothetical protein
MSNLFWLTDEQVERLTPFFPKSHVVLSRFGAGPLIAQCTAKEMNHGHSENG